MNKLLLIWNSVGYSKDTKYYLIDTSSTLAEHVRNLDSYVTLHTAGIDTLIDGLHDLGSIDLPVENISVKEIRSITFNNAKY